MINMSKLALIAAMAAISFASPAFAQALNKGDGTGSVSAFAYGPGGSKPAYEPGPGSAVAPQQVQTASRASHTVAIRQNGQRIANVGVQGLYNYAGAPPAGEWDSNSNSAAATGGGSSGYNQMVLTH
jgi:hypothetical protein